jgi:hypothetical protein
MMPDEKVIAEMGEFNKELCLPAPARLRCGAGGGMD